MAALIRHIVPRRIRIDVNCAPDLKPVSADPATLDQVILNLALNARDAMPEGGSLTLSAAPAKAGGKSRPQKGDYISVTVADTGSGMDAATKARLFEPFFTTKPPGKGTGLGLSVVASIVREHYGWIEVESEPGKGSVFTFFLPEWQAEQSRRAA